jgi:hypothetical protein
MCGGFIGNLSKGLGLSPQDSQAPIPSAADAQGAADTKAAQSSNAKLAARNARRSASLLATGAGDTGMVTGASTAKTVLGA